MRHLFFLPASKKPFVDIQHALDLIFEQPVGVVIFDGSFQDGQQRGVVFFGLPDRPAGEKSQPYAFTVRPVRYRIKENTFIQKT